MHGHLQKIRSTKNYVEELLQIKWSNICWCYCWCYSEITQRIENIYTITLFTNYINILEALLFFISIFFALLAFYVENNQKEKKLQHTKSFSEHKFPNTNCLIIYSRKYWIFFFSFHFFFSLSLSFCLFIFVVT